MENTSRHYNRPTIFRTANKLRKNGYSLSRAFIIAWTLAKGREVKVNGTTFSTRQEAIVRLTRYPMEQVRFTLLREESNPHDKNAVSVMVSVNGSQAYKIGYIPAIIAPTVSAILNNGTAIRAQLKAIVGGIGHAVNYGLRLNMSL